MGTTKRLSCLILLAFLSLGTSEERVWLSTITEDSTEITDAVTASTTSIPSTTSTSTSSEDLTTLDSAPSTTPLHQVASTTTATTTEYDSILPVDKNDSQVVLSESVDAESGPAAVTGNPEAQPDILTTSGENRKKKPRKWMSAPVEEELPRMFDVEGNPLNVTEETSVEILDDFEIDRSKTPSVKVVESMDMPRNSTQEFDGVPVMTEMIMSKKTTIYVTFMENMPELEPVYVNLTGIRSYSGQERKIFGGLLDLSDLQINGEEVKEVIQRMAKQKFHRLDLSNNDIKELPTSTFSPLAFTLRELRLDGNPLASNPKGMANGLQRGGLFHLTELRELNLSSCGLEDIDLFTPWNSNHLEVIDLSNNALTSAPSNLQFFHNLKKLYLDGNPIARIGELPFALLWGLHTLTMTGCELTTIELNPFRNIEKLKELSLAGNNLTRIRDVHLPRSAATKLWLSGNPWHCSCEMLKFIERHQYAIRDLEEIRCSTPRWLEGLRTAYLTKEILSLDSVDGDCPLETEHVERSIVAPSYRPYASIRADRLEVLSLTAFALAAVFMVIHVLWGRRKNGCKSPEDREDINYIKIEKRSNFK